MALQAAMDFLDAIPGKAGLETALADAGGYEDLSRIGMSEGFIFTAGELDLAFRHRCAIRWFIHFAKGMRGW